jgi:hypothetical protein
MIEYDKKKAIPIVKRDSPVCDEAISFCGFLLGWIASQPNG